MILRLRLFLQLMLILSFLSVRAQVRWETLVETGNICAYLLPDSPVDASWIQPDFVDSGWKHGSGGVGYGDDDDMTLVDTCISVFCRYIFQLSDPALVKELVLDVDFDDGFVAYLNGTELGRYHMGDAGSPTAWDQEADGYHEALLYQGLLPMRFTTGTAGPELLREGENVLAVQVHNSSRQSSDLSSNIFLHASTDETSLGHGNPPAWFSPPYSLDSTNLPLMIIETGGQDIPDEPRIAAHMGLIHDWKGGVNRPSDSLNVYDGRIAIEIRGESSAYFYDKKNYSFETQTDSGTRKNVSMLGLPPENDFVLHGPYGDKAQVRNALSYSLFAKMGHYASRIRFLELIIDGDYKGLYLLLEKVKRDEYRVDIEALTPEDTAAIGMSGGYILRIDKYKDLQEYEYWESGVTPPVEGHRHYYYQYFDPPYEGLSQNQRDYIRDWLNIFEFSMAAEDFTDPETGYRAYMDVPSFIDLMILNEFTKDVDAFRLSHYFYKRRDDRGGKLYQGPPWDYNLTFGNNDFAGDVNLPEEWIYDKDISIWWWERIMQDPWFRDQLFCRWEFLAATLLSPGKLDQMLDTMLEYIGPAVERNYERWPVLGIYVWPNSFVGDSYAEEIDFLRTWMKDRRDWMDGEWGGRCSSTQVGDVLALPHEISVYPNPSDLSNSYVSGISFLQGPFRIRVYSIRGSLAFDSQNELAPEAGILKLPDLSFLEEGMYILEISNQKERAVARMIRR